MGLRPYFDDQGRVLAFEQLMQLEKINDRTFRSVTKGYAPSGREHATYGGFVYAQAAWAAAQTVDEGFLIHVSGTYGEYNHVADLLEEHHGLVYARG